MREMKFWEKCTPQEQIERWENVERVLKGLTPHQRRKHWNMNYFGMKTECGTIACAAGHCGMDPWFRRRGFRLNFHKGLSSEGAERWFEDIDDVDGFFGNEGGEGIFYNWRQRPVSKVIKEVRAHIKTLREKAA